jgi:hypothetical protein
MFGGYPPTAIGCPPTAIGCPPTAIGYPPTAISYPPAAIIGRIGHSEFFFFFFSYGNPWLEEARLMHWRFTFLQSGSIADV